MPFPDMPFATWLPERFIIAFASGWFLVDSFVQIDAKLIARDADIIEKGRPNRKDLFKRSIPFVVARRMLSTIRLIYITLPWLGSKDPES